MLVSIIWAYSNSESSTSGSKIKSRSFGSFSWRRRVPEIGTAKLEYTGIMVRALVYTEALIRRPRILTLIGTLRLLYDPIFKELSLRSIAIRSGFRMLIPISAFTARSSII